MKNQGFLNGSTSHRNTVVQRQMDSRSYIRQGVLTQRRSNFRGSLFPAITNVARKAVAMPIRSTMVNRNMPRFAPPPVQRKAADGGSARKEASCLLSEIAGPETHPKIVKVLLEHQCTDVALTVLRCIGRDAFPICLRPEHDGFQVITSSEAVAAVRVRIESGMLTEAFTYQRMYCSKVKKIASKNGSSLALSSNYKNGNWLYQVEVLVSEICHLCIRRNLVDRMIELPWNSDEEKFLHKCLLSHACQDSSSIYGSLLVVFYLQDYMDKKPILGEDIHIM